MTPERNDLSLVDLARCYILSLAVDDVTEAAGIAVVVCAVLGLEAGVSAMAAVESLLECRGELRRADENEGLS